MSSTEWLKESQTQRLRFMYSALTFSPRQHLCGNYDPSNWKGDSEVTWMFLESLRGSKSKEEAHHEGKFVLFFFSKKKRKKKKYCPVCGNLEFMNACTVSVIVASIFDSLYECCSFSISRLTWKNLNKKWTAWGSDLFLLQRPGALETCVKLSCTAYFPDIWPCRQSTDRSAPWREKVLS